MRVTVVGIGHVFIACLFCSLICFSARSVSAQSTDRSKSNLPGQRRLSLQQYREKLEAGWLGQIAGVCWGAPTEFVFKNRIIPEEDVPEWKPEMINDAFKQDDLYVEMTFLKTLEDYGLDVSPRQAGIDFANSGYQLWHANLVGRGNLRKGIAPPDSGHPRFNGCSDDIDYQIEADYSGLVAPGMPNIVTKLGDTFGRMMNYGDGLYAGQFVGAMYAEAYFEDDIRKIIETALLSIPQESQYAEMVRDVCRWYDETPDDWEKAWKKINVKYQENPDYRRVSCDPGEFNIDAKINGAYVLMGLLYGQGDLDRTIIISMRCGQDSDCNPSSAAGVLATSLGRSKLPAKFTEKLSRTGIFSHTSYSFPGLLEACERITRQAVLAEGGRIEKDDAGNETFVIPVKTPQVGPYVPSFQPAPITGARFTADEMAKIKPQNDYTFGNIQDGIDRYYPGWTITDCGIKSNVGIRDKYRGKTDVLVTHPKLQDTPCVLSRSFEVPEGKKTTLKLLVACQNMPDASWELLIRVNGQVVKQETISRRHDVVPAEDWREIQVDLSRFAGRTVELELVNQATASSANAAFWAKINLFVQ